MIEKIKKYLQKTKSKKRINKKRNEVKKDLKKQLFLDLEKKIDYFSDSYLLGDIDKTTFERKTNEIKNSIDTSIATFGNGVYNPYMNSSISENKILRKISSYVKKDFISLRYIELNYLFKEYNIIKKIMSLPVKHAFNYTNINSIDKRIDDNLINKKINYVRNNIFEAITLSRYFGGGVAIICGDEETKDFNYLNKFHSEPIINFQKPLNIKKGNKINFFFLSRWDCNSSNYTTENNNTIEDFDNNVNINEYIQFKKTVYFRGVEIHPSRLVFLSTEEVHTDFTKQILGGFNPSVLEDKKRDLINFLTIQESITIGIKHQNCLIHKKKDFDQKIKNKNTADEMVRLVNSLLDKAAGLNYFIIDNEDDLLRQNYDVKAIENSDLGYRELAGACGIPVSILKGERGESFTSTTGTNQDERQYKIFLKTIQNCFEPFIKTLINCFILAEGFEENNYDCEINYEETSSYTIEQKTNLINSTSSLLSTLLASNVINTEEARKHLIDNDLLQLENKSEDFDNLDEKKDNENLLSSIEENDKQKEK